VFLCRVPRKTTPGVGGFLISVTDSGDSLKWIGTGISLVGASGPILTIVNDVGQVCHVLVVAACIDLAGPPSFLHHPEGVQSGECWLWLS